MLFSIIAGICALSKLQNSHAFTATQQPGWMLSKRSADQRISSPIIRLYARQPSRVSDDFGPTPDLIESEIEEVDIPEEFKEDLEELPPGPIPYQPWRRGETDGCEDPITADWRVQAEDLIYKAAKVAGGEVLDVTWFLTSVLVTLDEDVGGASDIFGAQGPVIEVKIPRNPLYYDPNDPTPEEIWEGDDIVYERETEEETEERKQKKRNMYANKDENDPEDEPHIPIEDDDTEAIGLYMNKETRADAALTEFKEAKAEYDDAEKPLTKSAMLVDKVAISNIAGAIIEVLEDAEEELRILSRHDLVLASAAPPGMLETQKQFNAHRGLPVIVETVDPWQSNRDLKGLLLDRNSMDVLINKKGRIVTIPQNFVKCCRIPPPLGSPELEEEDEDYEAEAKDEDYEAEAP